MLVVGVQMVSSALLYRDYKRSPSTTHITLDWKSARLYPIPSLIYLVHNNVQFLTLKCVASSCSCSSSSSPLPTRTRLMFPQLGVSCVSPVAVSDALSGGGCVRYTGTWIRPPTRSSAT
jgi:hypothetical protein